VSDGGHIRGVIEGFYGRPWSWDERVEVMAWCHERAMTHYVYAPKDDPKHRHEWRQPYEQRELDGFDRLVGAGTLAVGFAVSPGLSIDPWSPHDRAALASKVDQLVGLGVELVVLALDDIPFGGGPQGEAHAALTGWLRDHLGDRATLVLVPTEYVGGRASPDLDALASGVPDDVPIAWTGAAVMNDVITVADARRRRRALGGRPPMVWDNYPVNDGMMADRLHLGPLWGREPALLAECAGWLANPMVQARASRLPLASVAAWLRGDDPLTAWATEADRLGWRVFAEACDGSVPRALVDAHLAGSDHGELRAWLTDASTCQAPGLDDDVGAWIDQVHAEAAVCLDALQLLDLARAGDTERGLAVAMGLAFTWPALRRTPVSVFGVRCGFRPELGQAADGRWAYRVGSLLDDQNATDALVRAALAELAAATA
jgi:hypothetical protein